MPFYILSSPNDDAAGWFKIGVTDKSADELLNQYSRGNPRAYFRLFIECNDPCYVESELLKIFKNRVVQRRTGNDSEWVVVPFRELFPVVVRLLEECNSRPVKKANTRTKETTDHKAYVLDKNQFRNRLERVGASTVSLICDLFNIDVSRPSKQKIPDHERDLIERVVEYREDRLLGAPQVVEVEKPVEVLKVVEKPVEVPTQPGFGECIDILDKHLVNLVPTKTCTRQTIDDCRAKLAVIRKTPEATTGEYIISRVEITKDLTSQKIVELVIIPKISYPTATEFKIETIEIPPPLQFDTTNVDPDVADLSRRDAYLKGVYEALMTINSRFLLIYSETRCSIGIGCGWNEDWYGEFGIKKQLPPGYKSYYLGYNFENRIAYTGHKLDNAWFGTPKLKPYLENIIQYYVTSKLPGGPKFEGVLNVDTERGFLCDDANLSLEAMGLRKISSKFENLQIAKDWNSYDCDADTYADTNKVYRYVFENLYSNHALNFFVAKKLLNKGVDRFDCTFAQLRFIAETGDGCLRDLNLVSMMSNTDAITLTNKSGATINVSKFRYLELLEILKKIRVVHWQLRGLPLETIRDKSNRLIFKQNYRGYGTQLESLAATKLSKDSWTTYTDYKSNYVARIVDLGIVDLNEPSSEYLKNEYDVVTKSNGVTFSAVVVSKTSSKSKINEVVHS